MAHAQQQILDAVQAVLAAGGTVAGARVYLDRVDPLQATELPAVLIEEDGGEQAEQFTVHGIDKRSLSVAVHCVLAHSTTAASDARAFGLAVEKLLAASTSLAAKCSQGWRMTGSRQVNNGDGDRLLASRHQTWVFEYLVQATAPDVLI
jgi:hypothetical protein